MAIIVRLVQRRHAVFAVLGIGNLQVRALLQAPPAVPLVDALRDLRGHLCACVVTPCGAVVALDHLEVATVLADVTTILAQRLRSASQCGLSADASTVACLRVVLMADGCEDDGS